MSDEREPALEELRSSVEKVIDELRIVLGRRTWVCDMGHRHERPEKFTWVELRRQLQSRPADIRAGERVRVPSSAVCNLAIHKLLETKELEMDNLLSLSVGKEQL